MRPRVSVLVSTYDQVAWIGQALDGVLRQVVDFPIEIRVGDDFSTDGTRTVLEDYRRRHPGLVHLHLQDRHHGGVPGRVNFLTTLAACRGEYLAFLDGDDFWTDPGKLARQVAILDADPSLSGAAHDAAILREGGADLLDAVPGAARFSDLAREDHAGAGRIGLRDLIVSPAYQTSTWLVRADALRDLPGWFAGVHASDWALFAIAARSGDVLLERDIRSVYRRHGGSILAQLRAERQAARNRWHRSSFLAIADAFPDVPRGPGWRRVDARSRLNERVDQRRPALALLDAARLFCVHDRRRLAGLARHPLSSARRFASVARRMALPPEPGS